MNSTGWIAARTALAALTITTFASTALSQSNDARTIRELSDQWQRDIAAQNVDAIVALHAPDAIVMMSHAPVATGSTAIRGMWGEAVKTPGLNLHWTPTKIEVVSPTRAIEYGTYTESFDTPQGKGNDAGTYVTIWHKINGKWRVALDSPNTTTPLEPAASSSASTNMGNVKELVGAGLTWSDFSPPGFDPGMKLAVLEGDPGAKGHYVLRLQFPAGYKFPVHWHPGVENLTVVSGPFQLGMGNTADWSALKTYAPGDYLYSPPKHAHFGGSAASGASVIQLHGEGPFQVVLGAPK
jgi:ketosteroid isomerase-like protein/quercetin dioxygenase-like cupin family protein